MIILKDAVAAADCIDKYHVSPIEKSFKTPVAGVKFDLDNYDDMDLTRVILYLLSKKLLGGLMVVSVLTLALPSQPAHRNIDTEDWKNETLAGKQIMHDGINTYLEVQGWDGSTYLAGLELDYHKSVKAGCILPSLHFLMIQKGTGITYEVPTLNMIGTGNKKLRYTCLAENDSTRNGNVLVRFSKEEFGVLSGMRIDKSTDHIPVNGLYDRWNAYIDSTFTRLNDTTLLLKFRLVRT